jgi:hypothetical protein
MIRAGAAAVSEESLGAVADEVRRLLSIDVE